jgi:hypothetical protein
MIFVKFVSECVGCDDVCFSQEMHAQVRHLNTRIRELLSNSADLCARELKKTFRDLLDQELASIEECGSMRQVELPAFSSEIIYADKVSTLLCLVYYSNI